MLLELADSLAVGREEVRLLRELEVGGADAEGDGDLGRPYVLLRREPLEGGLPRERGRLAEVEEEPAHVEP